MSVEHDSWFKSAFGVDLGQSLQGVSDGASAMVGQAASAVTQVVQGVQGAVEGALDEVPGAVTGAVKKVAGAVSGLGEAGPASGSGGGTGSFPLGGSVGRGGKNAPYDVRGVQAALGIVGVDGQCGEQTISALEAFQRSIGQARPDGRVDAGDATERTLAGGPKAAHAPAAPEGDDLRGLTGVPEDAAPDDGSGSATGDAARNDQIRAEIAAQINAQTANQAGLNDQLNNLEDFTKTDPDPVPDFPQSLAGVDPAQLANDIKEKQFTIDQMDKQRIAICKQARAGAYSPRTPRRATSPLLLSAALVSALAPVLSWSCRRRQVVHWRYWRSWSLRSSRSTRFYRYRDTIRSIVNKAHSDLTVTNTSIAIENMKLAAMQGG